MECRFNYNFESYTETFIIKKKEKLIKKIKVQCKRGPSAKQSESTRYGNNAQNEGHSFRGTDVRTKSPPPSKGASIKWLSAQTLPKDTSTDEATPSTSSSTSTTAQGNRGHTDIRAGNRDGQRQVISGETTNEKFRNHLNIVLLGLTGTGKSASGNTILKGERFPSFTSSVPVTKECQVCCMPMGQTEVRVIDTPDFFDEAVPEQDKQLIECIEQCQTGYTVYLLVIQVGRFTEGEHEILTSLEKAFGKDISKDMIVLFTHGDELKGARVGLRSSLACQAAPPTSHLPGGPWPIRLCSGSAARPSLALPIAWSPPISPYCLVISPGLSPGCMAPPDPFATLSPRVVCCLAPLCSFCLASARALLLFGLFGVSCCHGTRGPHLLPWPHYFSCCLAPLFLPATLAPRPAFLLPGPHWSFLLPGPARAIRLPGPLILLMAGPGPLSCCLASSRPWLPDRPPFCSGRGWSRSFRGGVL
ncbi:hypothetical protein UPYG_G00054720 [Umbra pygmaea]|uniref:AIG1-type G domain-containing protein n=1 Tax=Umbra pygmaea TaxID=75934 RepID=A0ABD0X8N7_UMBPY